MTADPARIEKALEALEAHERCCRLCPRKCRVDRRSGKTGLCGLSAGLHVAAVLPHFGEEPELVGRGGSGTIFFGGCNLSCLFCQNADISQRAAGRTAGPEELARLMLSLEAAGCENVNLVTPTHFAPTLGRATRLARRAGLGLPVVWNCGGYEDLEAVRLLDGLVEIFMPDFKYGPAAPAGELSGAPDYFDRCCDALAEMHRQVGVLATDPRGVARRGVLIRHLVLPDGLADSPGVLRFIAGLSTESYVNIMDQYRPSHRAQERLGLERRTSAAEMREVRECARSLPPSGFLTGSTVGAPEKRCSLPFHAETQAGPPGQGDDPGGGAVIAQKKRGDADGVRKRNNRDAAGRRGCGRVYEKRRTGADPPGGAAHPGVQSQSRPEGPSVDAVCARPPLNRRNTRVSPGKR